MRKVPHGKPPKRCATQDGWMGIKPKDMQVADCVAIPILVAGLSYKGSPVLRSCRASFGEAERESVCVASRQSWRIDASQAPETPQF
ncbi:hypothetical protein J3E69DRAFT_327932 [Trichoderma sp. SZMC 28015]